MTIPIRNLYYLFCYAWERFPEGDAVEVGVDDCPDPPNLFARVLVTSLNRLLRRGLDRGYLDVEEERRSPRGKILIDASLKAQTWERGVLVCRFDELSRDVLHNRILKATALLLARDNQVRPGLAHELRVIVKGLADVSDIRVRLDHFSRVQLSRQTGAYRQLLQLCEFVWRSQMPQEGGEGSRFSDILKDEEKMSRIFELFLLNFYRMHADGFSADPEEMRWRIEEGSTGDRSLIPVMRTDITLRSRSDILVIDAKFYADPFPRSWGAPRLRSGHLYQLFAYLKHAGRDGSLAPVRGALVYAAPQESIQERYRIDGHDVTIATVDLSCAWSDIHDALLAIVSPPPAPE